MEEKTVKAPAISCNHCVMTIKRKVSELDGVASVNADPDTKMVTVKWIEPMNWETISKTLAEIGFAPED